MVLKDDWSRYLEIRTSEFQLPGRFWVYWTDMLEV